MRKFSKLCAAALAMALSITMVAPISANAQVYWEKDANGNYTVKNEDTDKSVKMEDVEDGDKDAVAFAIKSRAKSVTISTNSYNEVVYFITTSDVAKYKNFKSSKKSAMKVKVIDQIEVDNNLTKGKERDFDYQTKDKKYHYRNVKNDLVETANYNDLPDGKGGGYYGVRLYAKKPGTYKVKFEAELKNGGTEKLSLKVIAKDNGEAIKDITFAGKSLTNAIDEDAEAYALKNNRLWEKGFGANTTLAKKGTIRVTMNENFKLKKIEYGVYETKDVNGQKERVNRDSSLDPSYKIKWKKVKNGKKIKLSKVDFDKNSFDKDGIKVKTSGNTETTTFVRITYKDTKAKVTRRVIYSIQKINK
ncbi:hypothetical protein [Butyrivibrio sp. XPD2002]|uniref:hypothetical protein n=1 Tax=Butyrivibrio sp. XPD2002 TaxID=1280665 RepID=UPI00042425C7|nr:hypothetical protein [Butyrivibrio sp. XPD2002]